MNEDDEFKILVLGALNFLIGLTAANGLPDQSYYDDWLARERKLIDAILARRVSP
jgi:hypothetical protein